MTKPIILVKICYKLLYFETSLIGDFLASADIKAFGIMKVYVNHLNHLKVYANHLLGVQVMAESTCSTITFTNTLKCFL